MTATAEVNPDSWAGKDAHDGTPPALGVPASALVGGDAATAPAPHEWRDLARCADAQPDLFFPRWGDRTSERAAKRICNGMPQQLDGQVLGPSRTSPCPVREECLAAALRHEAGKHTHDRHGIFGGLTPNQRAALDAPRPERAPNPDPRPSCWWPGRKAGAQRHRDMGTELCAACLEYTARVELHEAGVRRRDERILHLAAAGKSPWEIALSMGLDKSNVKRIIARHESGSRLESDPLELVLDGQVAVGD